MSLGNASLQYAQKGEVDWVKAGLSSYGYSPAGAAMKFEVLTGADMAIAGVKGFLSSTNSAMYSLVQGSLHEPLGQASTLNGSNGNNSTIDFTKTFNQNSTSKEGF